MFDRVSFVDSCAHRANIIEWLPFAEGQSVLIHSSAPAPVLDFLKTKKVQLQVLSDAQFEKLAYNPGRGMLDYVLILGMEVNAKFLSGLYRKLKQGGRLVVLLHNKYGMSYFSGKPAYDEAYFASLTEGTGEKSIFYSVKGVKKLLKDAGIDRSNMYYPDPDGMFAVNIYSDKCLPKAGDINTGFRNFIQDRVAMFDENEALNRAAEEGMFAEFANDYLIITGAELPIQMVRYSNDRAMEYQIKTEICAAEVGKWVQKSALHETGIAHVKKMVAAYEKLCQQYDKEVFTIVPCEWTGDSVAFPFVKGETLAEKMQKALQAKDLETVFSLFHTFLGKLRKGRQTGFSNYDFIFSNIIIEDDNWQVIDYEWTMEMDAAPEELAFRAAYCFSLEHKDFPFEDICRILDFNKNKVQKLIEKETVYQKKITGSQMSLDSVCAQHGGAVFTGAALLRALEISTSDHKVQVYEDRGKGFSEEQSYFVERALTSHDEMELTLKAAAGMKALRIDPCEEPCLIQIKKLWWNGTEQFLDKQIEANGVKGKSTKNGYAEYVFATKDPNFTIPLEKLPGSDKSFNELKLHIEIHKISLQLANTLTKSIKRII